MKKLTLGILSLGLMLVSSWTLNVGPWAFSTYAAFSDVPDSHPYNAAINFVQAQGIVGGYPDGTYQPDRILNRAEFVKIIIESRFDENTINSCINRGGFYDRAIFSDVEPGVWFEKYVCVAKSNTIIQGYEDGTFRPTQLIIFAEAAKILSESYGLKIGTGDPWFQPYVARLGSLDAVPPTLASINDFIQRGIKEITRGEMADTIYRLRFVNDTVFSDDGSVALQVPERALPSGLDAQSIRITKLSEEENPVQEVNGAPMIFYKLEPDGVQFAEPITLRVETQTVANTVPLVFLVSGDSFDVIPDPTIEIDQNQRLAFLTAHINHFSSVGLGFPDYFELSDVQIIPTGNQKAGTPFQASIDVSRTSGPPAYILESTGDLIELTSDWTLESAFFETAPGTLTPYLQLAGSVSKQEGVNDYSFNASFNCSPQGANNIGIEYEGTITWEYFKNESSVETQSIIRSQSNSFDCAPLDQMEVQYEEWKQFAFEHVNELRAQEGVGPLQYNPLLSAIADVHARDMALNIGELSHEGSLGEQSWTRIEFGQVIDLNTNNSYTTLPAPSNVDRTGENVGRRNIDAFGGSAEQAIIDQHQWFLSTPAEGVTHRTTMLSTHILFSEVGIGLYLDDANNLWIVQNYISLL